MRFLYTFLLLCAVLAARAQTNVRAWYAEGQVWVVWELDLPLPETYGIYASPQPFSNIEDAILLGRPFYLEYLPFALRAQIDSSMNYRIPDGMGGIYELAPNEGLFVATPHQAGAMYFAVTAWGDSLVQEGVNITDDAVPFSYEPENDPVECHLQTTLPSPSNPDYTCRVYVLWADGRQNYWESRPDFPVMANAAKNGMPSLFIACVPNDFDNSEPVPLTIWLHGGQGDAQQSVPGKRRIIDIDPEEGILVAHNDDVIGWRVDEPHLGGKTWHFGWRKNWDPFTQLDLPLTTDTVINYTQRRYLWIDEWLIKNFNVDPKRINLNGHSMGSAGCTALAKCYPSHYASAAIHSNGFQGPGTVNAAIVFGNAAQNFPTNLVNREGQPVRFYDLWNLIDNCSPERDWPLMRTWHGKQDANDAMAWDADVVENYRLADSLGMGVQIFWSERGHNLNTSPIDHWYHGNQPDEQIAYDNTDYEEAHFRSDTWLPAFFNHRLDDQARDPGDGTPGINGNGSGDDWGTWGGYHRWSELEAYSDAGGPHIEGTFWLEGGAVYDNENCPIDSLQADLYIRRLPDSLNAFCGANLMYSLTSLDDNYVATGMVDCTDGELMKLEDVLLFRKGIRRLRLEIALPVSTASVEARTFRALLYPNPVADIARLSVETEEAGLIHLRLLDLQGRRLLQQAYPCLPGRNELELPVQNLPAGMYFLQFSNEQGEGGVLRMLVR